MLTCVQILFSKISFLPLFTHTIWATALYSSYASLSFSPPLKPVSLNPVLHQFFPLRSRAQGEPRDYQGPTSAVVPISALCRSQFIKIKGFFLRFTPPAPPPPSKPPSRFVLEVFV